MAGAQYSAFYAALFQRHAYEVEIIMGNDGPLRTACAAVGIPSRVIPFRNVLIEPLGDARALAALTRHWRTTRPHIVQTHSSKAGMLGRAAARLARVPIVIHTYHGPSYHSRQPAPVRWGIKTLERVFAPLSDHIVSVAESLTEDLTRDRICSPDRVSTIVSGIDFDAFPADPSIVRNQMRESLGIPEQTRVVIAVGYLTPGKGFDLLVEAAARLRTAAPDAHYLIVGPIVDSTTFRDELVRRVDQLGMGDCIRFCGHRDDVPALLCAADIFVQTSWREGLSRALVEAMYTGLAVVATDVNGTREVVVDGETGYLVPPGDPGTMADRLLRLLRDPEMAAQLGSNARRHVGTTRSVETMGRELDALYRRLMDRKGLVVVRNDAPAASVR